MINQDYLFCETWTNVKEKELPPNSLYIYAQDTEARSIYCPHSLTQCNEACYFAEVKELEEDVIDICGSRFAKRTISLYSPASILGFVKELNPTLVYLDVTGMSSRVVAPVLKALLEGGTDMRVVYVEPQEYIIEEFQREGINKDLSETIDGVDPLPGFGSFMPLNDDTLFVALLGFEGWRFAYLLKEQEPADDKIRPIVGVPGYKMKYPFDSLWGNRQAINKTECWRYLDFAEANSIVDVYFKLEELYKDSRRQRMVIAPIGTKPHVIGAVLYAIKHDDRVELLYDNPKRTLHRTKGVGRVMVCDVTSLYKA